MKESTYFKGEFYDSETFQGSIRWMAYDFFHHDMAKPFRPSAKTDVWAFGMILLVRQHQI